MLARLPVAVYVNPTAWSPRHQRVGGAEQLAVGVVDQGRGAQVGIVDGGGVGGRGVGVTGRLALVVGDGLEAAAGVVGK